MDHESPIWDNMIVVVLTPDPEHPDAEAVRRAVEQAIESRREQAEQAKKLANVIASLPRRQSDVLRLSLAGMTIRVIARNLRVSTSTVDRDKLRAVKALGAKSYPDAVRILTEAKVTLPGCFRADATP